MPLGVDDHMDQHGSNEVEHGHSFAFEISMDILFSRLHLTSYYSHRLVKVFLRHKTGGSRRWP